MVRGPKSGNGTQPSVYYLDSADLPAPWNGAGQLNLQSVQVAGIKAQDPRHAVVTLPALVSGQLMEPGVPVAATGSGLVVCGAVIFDQISALHVPPGGTTRQITVTVIWKLPEPPGSVTGGNHGVTSKLEMTYGMSVVDLQGGKWYVKEIGASSEAVGAR